MDPNSVSCLLRWSFGRVCLVCQPAQHTQVHTHVAVEVTVALGDWAPWHPLCSLPGPTQGASCKAHNSTSRHLLEEEGGLYRTPPSSPSSSFHCCPSPKSLSPWSCHFISPGAAAPPPRLFSVTFSCSATPGSPRLHHPPSLQGSLLPDGPCCPRCQFVDTSLSFPKSHKRLT